MKLSFLLRPLAILTLLGTLTFVACKKEGSNTTTQVDETSFATISSESDAEAEAIFDDVFDNVVGVNDDVAIGGTGVFNRTATDESGLNRTDDTPCFTVTVTLLEAPKLFPVKIVLDFGTGCVGRDGRTRKGKIISVYTGRLTVPGNSVTTTFDGYYVNNIKVEGVHKIENQSTSSSWVFAVTVRDARLTKPNGNFSQWNSSKIITQVEGLGTPLWPRDDVFSITGETNGAVKKDTVYYQWSAKTIEPLFKKFTCIWIVKGTIGIGRTNTSAAVIDYGNGDCDNKATVTINGVTHEITLH